MADEPRQHYGGSRAVPGHEIGIRRVGGPGHRGWHLSAGYEDTNGDYDYGGSPTITAT